jgi:hypothetical protein
MSSGRHRRVGEGPTLRQWGVAQHAVQRFNLLLIQHPRRGASDLPPEASLSIFSVVLATSRNLLPAEAAHCAELPNERCFTLPSLGLHLVEAWPIWGQAKHSVGRG